MAIETISTRIAEIRAFTIRTLGEAPYDRKVLSAYAAAAARWEITRSEELATPSGPNAIASERLAAAVRQLAVRLGIDPSNGVDLADVDTLSQFAVDGVTNHHGYLCGDPARLLAPFGRQEL